MGKYSHLDTILEESDEATRKKTTTTDDDNGEGRWVTTPKDIEKIRKEVDDLEKILRET